MGLLEGLPVYLPKAQDTPHGCVLWGLGWGLGRPPGGEGALPDGSDGSLQGGDHVFNEEVIPVAPVFCHGVTSPGIWEGDTQSMAGHSLGRLGDPAQSGPS